MQDKPRTAIVTGAGKRVGAVIAAGLIADGWTVVAHVHHDGDDVPAGAVKVIAELTDPGCGDAIFAAAEALPPVALLVNNAARFAPDSLGDFQPDELDAHMAVNLRAPVLLTEAFARRHVAGSDAAIVNLLDSKLAALNPGLPQLHLVEAGAGRLHRIVGESAGFEGYPRQRHRSRADAKIDGAERRELRARPCR